MTRSTLPTRATTRRVPMLVTATAAAALAVGACTDPNPLQVRGVRTLHLGLATADTLDGALLVSVTGPRIVAVRGNPALQLFERRGPVTAGGPFRSTMLVRGTLAPGATLAEVDVAGGAAGEYTAVVEQAAGGKRSGYASVEKGAVTVLLREQPGRAW